MVHGDGQAAIGFRTVNFDKEANRELTLGDFLEGAADRSKPLEALAAYARADLKERTGEEGDEESDALLDLTRPDLGTYERFTLCPSTKLGSAAGLTFHFPLADSPPLRRWRFPRYRALYGLRQVSEAWNEGAVLRRAETGACVLGRGRHLNGRLWQARHFLCIVDAIMHLCSSTLAAI